MNQKFFASLTAKISTLVLMFVLFGAAQQLNAQSLVTPTVAVSRLKLQSYNVDHQLVLDLDSKSITQTQLGLQYLRLEFYTILTDKLNSGGVSTQDALDKGALLLAEQYTKLPNTTVSLTSGHVQTLVSEATSFLLN